MSPEPLLTDHVPLTQSAIYQSALLSLGRTAWQIAEDGIGRMLVIERDMPIGQIRATMRGPLWHSHRPADQTDFLRRAGLHLVNADNEMHATALRKAGFIRVMTPAHLAIMDLCGDLPAAMAPKWRNAWRQSHAQDLHITADRFDAERDGWLLALDEAHQLAAHFQGYPRAFTLALAKADPANVWIYTAYHEDQPVAAMMFVTHAPTATYHLGWTSPDGRKYKAHHRILVQAALNFRDQALSNLDLGQVDTVRAPGLARFKWGSGARIVPTGGTWLRLPGWRE